MRKSYVRLVALCALGLGVLGRCVAAMDESSAGSSASADSAAAESGPMGMSGHNNHLSALLLEPREQLVGDKRAYTYRSEFKRLPLYQFGLGKRWAPGPDDKRTQRFSFGLGKRTRGYSFGLGKRSSYENADGVRLNYENIPNVLYDMLAQRVALEDYLQAKRTRDFNFGLGKRDSDVSDEKVPLKHLRDKYLFGLGKRFYEEDASEEVA